MTHEPDHSYWQQNDKSVMASVFLMLGAFAAIMIGVALGISFVL